MAIFHLSVNTISRSAGRSATAAAAYRAGISVTDERTGEIHDYTRKQGVEHTRLVLPDGVPEWATNRQALWNAAEQSEKRRNSTVAREFEIALPDELSPLERQKLACDFAREIVQRHGCVADVCIHAPGRGGDSRNHHAHILLSTRRLEPAGFTGKTRELDAKDTGPQIVTQWRTRFADLQNERLRACGRTIRVDHRSLQEQGIERLPTRHMGPAATGYERRTGQPSRRRDRLTGLQQEAAQIDQEIGIKQQYQREMAPFRVAALKEVIREKVGQAGRKVQDFRHDVLEPHQNREHEVDGWWSSLVGNYRKWWVQNEQNKHTDRENLAEQQRMKADQWTDEERQEIRQEARKRAEAAHHQAKQREQEQASLARLREKQKAQERALSFRHDSREKAQEKYPELKFAYQVMDEARAMAPQYWPDNVARQHNAVESLRQRIQSILDQGEIPVDKNIPPQDKQPEKKPVTFNKPRQSRDRGMDR